MSAANCDREHLHDHVFVIHELPIQLTDKGVRVPSRVRESFEDGFHYRAGGAVSANAGR